MIRARGWPASKTGCATPNSRGPRQRGDAEYGGDGQKLCKSVVVELFQQDTRRIARFRRGSRNAASFECALDEERLDRRGEQSRHSVTNPADPISPDERQIVPPDHP